MQIAGGLIGQQQRWRMHHRPRYAHKLLLPAGELVGKQVLLGHDLKAVEDIGHHAGAFLGRKVLVGERQVDILRDSKIVQQVIALEHHADALPREVGALFAVQPVDRGVAEPVLPDQLSSSRASTFSSDDFPAPDGPIMVTNSPSRMVIPMRRSTQVSVWPVL